MDICIYTPPPKKKSAKVNFLWGKMTSERLFNSFIHPQKLLYPQNKFLATPLSWFVSTEHIRCCNIIISALKNRDVARIISSGNLTPKANPFLFSRPSFLFTHFFFFFSLASRHPFPVRLAYFMRIGRNSVYLRSSSEFTILRGKLPGPLNLPFSVPLSGEHPLA